MHSVDTLFADILSGRAKPATFITLATMMVEQPEQVIAAFNDTISLKDGRRILDECCRQQSVGQLLLLKWLEHADLFDSLSLQRYLCEIVKDVTSSQADKWQERSTELGQRLASAATLMAELNEIEQRHAQMRERYAASKEEIEQIERLKVETQTWQTALRELEQADRAQLERKVGTLRGQHEQAERELRTLRRQDEELEDELQRLRRQHEQVRQRYAANQNAMVRVEKEQEEIRELQAALQKLEQVDRAELSRKRNELDAQRQQVEQELQTHREENQQRENELEQLREQSQAEQGRVESRILSEIDKLRRHLAEVENFARRLSNLRTPSQDGDLSEEQQEFLTEIEELTRLLIRGELRGRVEQVYERSRELNRRSS